MRVFSVSCARRSNGPVERAEGDVGSVSTGCQDVGSLQDKVTLSSGESTRTTRNVNLRDRNGRQQTAIDEDETLRRGCEKASLTQTPAANGAEAYASPPIEPH